MSTPFYKAVSFFIVILAAIGSVSAQDSNDDYFEDRERGFFWREITPVETEVEEVKPEDVAPIVPSVAPLSPREQLKQQGERWEDALATAILNPTAENYRAYLEQTDTIQQQSQDFAAGLKRSIWVTPEFDYTLEAPVSPEAIVVKSTIDSRADEQSLLAAANQKGLLFFFTSECEYCSRFAPILKQFEQQYGFTVVPISLDGAGIDGYENPQPNVALGQQLNVQNVPALYMVDPDRNSVATVGFGYTPWSELQQKVIYAASQIDVQQGGQ